MRKKQRNTMNINLQKYLNPTNPQVKYPITKLKYASLEYVNLRQTFYAKTTKHFTPLVGIICFVFGKMVDRMEGVMLSKSVCM